MVSPGSRIIFPSIPSTNRKANPNATAEQIPVCRAGKFRTESCALKVYSGFPDDSIAPQRTKTKGAALKAAALYLDLNSGANGWDSPRRLHILRVRLTIHALMGRL
jgi:hypothetical protein